VKITRINKIAGLGMALALVTGAAGISIAGEISTSKSQVAKVIELHAPNNASQSVTVWIPKAASRSARNNTAKPRAAKVLELHAPNNPTPSISIWTGE
jgi:hypothetical protein